MSFINPAPMAGYVTGDLIDESEINYWCAALPDCVDGAQGGTYTLANPLIFTGDDVQFDDVDITGDLVVSGNGTFDDSVQFNDDVGFAGGNPVNFYNGLTVAGTPTFNGYAVFTQGADLGNGTSDTFALKGVLTPTSGGRVQKTATTVTTALASVNVSDYQHVKITYGSTTTTTLTATAVSNGDWVVLFNNSGASQNFAGLFTLSGLADGESWLMIRVGGTWGRYG